MKYVLQPYPVEKVVHYKVKEVVKVPVHIPQPYPVEKVKHYPVHVHVDNPVPVKVYVPQVEIKLNALKIRILIRKFLQRSPTQ